MDLSKLQVVLVLLGEHGVGKTYMAQRLLSKFGFVRKVSIADVVRQIVTDTAVMGVPLKLLTEDKDKPFDLPIHIKEANLRRIMQKLERMLPPDLNFRAHKIAISNFPLVTVQTGRELLQYVGFAVINRLSVDYLPIIAYNEIVGYPGFYAMDDLRLVSELSLASQKFQLVKTVLIKTSKKKHKGAADGAYATEENEWKDLTPDFELINPMDTLSS